MKIAFLDRDGTIVSDYADEEWSVAKSPEFLEGAIDALKLFQEKEYKLIVVTNQYTIGEGFITHEQYESFTKKMLYELNTHGVTLMDIFCCPHARSENCSSTKPNPGMILRALKKYPNIHLHDSFLAGDTVADAGLANHFGLKFYGINLVSNFGKQTCVTSLTEIARLL